jgi:hypothetical protein
VRCQATLAAEPPRGWKLEVRPDASPTQRQRLATWLGEYLG